MRLPSYLLHVVDALLQLALVLLVEALAGLQDLVVLLLDRLVVLALRLEFAQLLLPDPDDLLLSADFSEQLLLLNSEKGEGKGDNESELASTGEFRAWVQTTEECAIRNQRALAGSCAII